MPTPAEYKKFFGKRGIGVSVKEEKGCITILSSKKNLSTIAEILSNIQQEGKFIITSGGKPFWKKLLFWVKG